MTPKHKKIARINITDLCIPTIIGTNAWEQQQKQDVLLNITLEFDATAACKSDDLTDTLDYKNLKQKIILFLETSRCGLLEKLTDQVLELIMKDIKVLAATVRIDKPRALRFAKSVSVEMSRRR